MHAEGAWLFRGESCGPAVAGEVPFLKDLDELVFAMALYRAGIADTGRVVSGAWVGRRRIARQTSENILTQRTELLGTVFNALRQYFMLAMDMLWSPTTERGRADRTYVG
jgi:hypothetical protein